MTNFSFYYEFKGKERLLIIPASSMDEAKEILHAIRETLILGGKLVPVEV